MELYLVKSIAALGRSDTSIQSLTASYSSAHCGESSNSTKSNVLIFDCLDLDAHGYGSNVNMDVS